MSSNSPFVLPPASAFPTLPPQSQTQILTSFFEKCPPLVSHLLPILTATTTPHDSYTPFIEQVRHELHLLNISENTQDQGKLLEILAAHPRLGEKDVESVMSRMEQRAMKQSEDRGTVDLEEEERIARELERLNKVYEETFPGMRYVVFVNGRPRPVIMENMRQRIARNSFEDEKVDAINAMCDIAHDRARKLLLLAAGEAKI
ncbi:Oxo-4-hydroxy-4-carboxy-5-ureidoimidazoline decarboxylase [Peziza echinospora]|nr:Oxo-4-hydroxy-4-carboxy-5-ureidoimidazoline decarboxylase [Peziza echinospora]